MRDWFDDLEARERVMVGAACIFVLFAIAWFAIWLPIDRGQKSTAQRVETWQSSLAALRPLRGQLQAASSSQQNSAGQGQSLVVIVDTTLRQRGLYRSLQRSQPTPGGDGIRVEFENAAFDDLVLWLGDLHSQYSLLVQSSSFSVTSDDNQGRVNASLTLER